jgi:pyrroloquinoline quinone biosynthesis protein B
VRQLLLPLLLLTGCVSPNQPLRTPPQTAPYVLVLGTAQDGGLPQLGCERDCCESARKDPDLRRLRTSLLLVDPTSGHRWLFEATPDLPQQLELARGHGAPRSQPTTGRPAPFDGIFLTHAHLGHYTGLAYLGREAYGAHRLPVYASERMTSFLTTNGPWSQLVELDQIDCRPVTPSTPIQLRKDLSVEAIPVPHREEFSDTYAWLIRGPNRSLLFLPDIDKWERWDQDINKLLTQVDYALLDATFFGPDELPDRDISTIPHPFIVESIARFSTLPPNLRDRVHFLHLNHSNPAANPTSPAAATVRAAGHHICSEQAHFPL